MSKNKNVIVFITVILALTTLACSFTVNLPFKKMNFETGPVATKEINIPQPKSSKTANVSIAFGAGKLNIERSGSEYLVQGSAKYNVPELEPTVTVADAESKITIEQSLKSNGFPNFPDDFVNDWNLSFGNYPLNLEIQAGAYQGHFDFGGLNIRKLEISDGVSDVDLDFSSPVQGNIDSFVYQTGASNINISNIANGHIVNMDFESGAGDYTLDFSGSLECDMNVKITTGVSNLTIIVPEDTHAIVNFDESLTSINHSDKWQMHGEQYEIFGTGATIRFDITIGTGSVHLETSEK